MARFLGNASGRTIGAPTGAAGFTKAKVFAGAGTTSFTVPQDVTKLKVFVVGAGSSYRTGTYAFCGANCCSGVAYPSACYCACFIGHLTGAGGGYAEKTFLQSSDLIAGKTLTINVGSIGGLSASSVSATGLATVTASNATESSYTWNCTNNSTARDNSNDNPIAIGIQLPVCGYVNNFSGYYNRGGTASGGDVNRAGGRGVLIPEFICDSYFDGLTCNLTVSGSTTNASSCWISPIMNSASAGQYHTYFGSNYINLSGCVCYYLCAGISNLCYGSGSGNQCYSSRYSFVGKTTKESGSNSPYGSENCMCTLANNAANQFIKDVPIGVGAQSGNSLNNGQNGYSDLIVTSASLTGGTTLSGSSSCSSYNTNYYSGNYDYYFGGTMYTCVSLDYFPGCFSANSCRSVGCSASFCYINIGNIQYGGPYNNICFCIPYGLGNSSGGGSGYRCSNRCYNLGFINDASSQTPSTGYSINLSTLVNENDLNSTDIGYGRGAGITTSASYGGGGNRLYPNGGSGLVVVIY